MSGIIYELGGLEKLRVSVGAWAAKNFGNTLPEENTRAYGMLRCVAGMAEELSETINSGYGLVHMPQDREAYLDGIADICIYALDFCSIAGLGMRDVLLHSREPSRWEKRHLALLRGIGRPQECVPILHEGLFVFIGELAHSSLKICRGIRKTEDHDEKIKMSMCHVWRCCSRLSSRTSTDLNKLVRKVAKKVLRRDWIKSPDKAHEVAGC